jgi:ATP-dependent 26S proteasome regulatory subunit
MYHGEGPKNVESIFLAAQRDNAVLFIDEADSLLSRRLTNVTQGSEQAINSMRSQLLICLEKFKGIVIFATNLAENYDKAFETRIRSIHFDMPDEACRKRIWECHIPSKFPLAEGLTRESVATELAKQDDFCGRDIRNAVKSVGEDLILTDKSAANIDDFLNAIERVRMRRLKSEDKPKGKDIPLDDDQKELLTDVIEQAKKKGQLVSEQTDPSETE